MTTTTLPYTMGWLPDEPDERDYTFKTPRVSPLPQITLPRAVDLREFDTPVMNQGSIGSCTANAACGLLQFLQNTLAGSYTPLSRLYLYYFTRMIMGTSGDSGASLRDTAMAVTMFGSPPETYWNYNVQRYDETPKYRDSEVFLSGMADNYEGLHYIRLTNMNDIKLCVVSRMPVMFGTLVWRQIMFANNSGDIALPPQGEQPVGGHALVIVGYDDDRGCIGIGIGTGTETKGAFLVRNSWGSEWGDHGYGWLPYEYLYAGHAQDFWTFQTVKYVNAGDFA